MDDGGLHGRELAIGVCVIFYPFIQGKGIRGYNDYFQLHEIRGDGTVER